MKMYEFELFRKESGESGEIWKTSTGYLVKKYCDFCIVYFSKRFDTYKAAREALTADGFKKASML